VIHYIVKALTKSVKDRLCCDYMIAMMHCPRKPKVFNMLRTASPQELTEIALSEKYSSSIRASAAWLLWGTDKLENNQLPFKQGSREAFTAMIEKMVVPPLVKYITLRGMIACRYPMNVVYPFLWLRMNKSQYYSVQTTRFPDKRHYVGGLPEEAFDQHSREGKSCLAYFAKACAPVDQWLTSRGVAERDKRIAAIGAAVFIIEGARLDRRLDFEGASEIYETTERIDYQNVGLSLDDGRHLAKMVEDNYGALRQSRMRVVIGQ